VIDREISLVFTAKRNIVSKVICAITGSRTSHVAFCFEVASTQVFLHANVGGVQISPRAKFLKKNKIVDEYVFVDSYDVNLTDAVNHIGERYDYVGVFGFIPVLVARWIGRKIKNPIASPNAMVCSEFIIKGVKLGEWAAMDPECTTPGDILKACERSSDFFPRNA
jgi:hypothetical protein